MALINCTKCGTLFPRKLRDICDSCLEEEKQNISIITNFVEKSESKRSLEEISSNTGISFWIVQNLFKNRMLMHIASKIKIRCKVCGVEIRSTGNSNFCSKCIETIKEDMPPPPPPPSKPARKMHVRESEKDRKSPPPAAPEKTKFGFKKIVD